MSARLPHRYLLPLAAGLFSISTLMPSRALAGPGITHPLAQPPETPAELDIEQIVERASASRPPRIETALDAIPPTEAVARVDRFAPIGAADLSVRGIEESSFDEVLSDPAESLFVAESEPSDRGSPVPEPASIVLVVTGLIGLMGLGARRRLLLRAR